MFCKNCGTNINDGELFCPACGTKQDVSETPVIASQPEERAVFVQTTAENNQAPVYNRTSAKKGFDVNAVLNTVKGFVKKIPVDKEAVKKLTKHKLFKPLSAVVAVLLVICIVVVPIINSAAKKGKLDFYLFVRSDSSLYLKYEDESSAKKLASDFDSSSMVTYVEDAEYLFFYKYSYSKGNQLYYVDISKKTPEEVKLDDGVKSYQVSENGKVVFYLTDNNKLYVHNLKDKTYIAADVDSYHLNEKGNKVTYFVYDDKEEDDNSAYSVYYAGKNGKSKTIAENVGPCIGSSREESVVFYNDRETLYSYTFGSKASKIGTIEGWASGVEVEVEAISSAKEFYLLVEAEYKYTDFINDEYNAEADKDVRYSDENYDDANGRTRIRNIFKDRYFECVNLYYVKGTKIESIAKALERWDADEENDTIVYLSRTMIDGKIDIMDLVAEYRSDDGNVNSYYDKNVFTSWAYNFTSAGKVSEIASAETEDELDFTNFKVDEKGKNLYYIADKDGTNSGDLYKVKISGNKLGKAKKLYSDVYSYMLDSKGTVITMRDYDNYEFDLYVKDKKVGTDITYSGLTIAQDDTIFFGTEYSYGEYLLNQCSGKKVVRIADDVYSYVALGKNKVLFVTDDGDLKEYRNKKVTNLAGGVKRIVPFDSITII